MIYKKHRSVQFNDPKAKSNKLSWHNVNINIINVNLHPKYFIANHLQALLLFHLYETLIYA